MLSECVKLLGERGYCKCKFGGDTCIGLEDIARKQEGARKSPPPPSGARVKRSLSFGC